MTEQLPLPEPEWLERKGLIFDPLDEDITKPAYAPLYTADQMHAHAAAVSAAKDARIKLLEGALRHVNKCLSINDYGDYVLLSLFDAEIVRTALGDKT